jgi:signal peptidase I
MSLGRKIYSIIVDLVETLVIAGAIFVVIYAFLFRPFQVNGQSMYPNYHNGEYILTNLIGLRISAPQRGSVVVFQAPVDAEKDFIKRVIGLPGDQVMVKDGSVYVNGKLLDESSYLDTSVKTYGGAFLADGQTITVPAHNYFVLGDNRNFSSDSREWGFVPEGKLIGKSFFVYWPLNEIRLVKQGKYPSN